MKTYKKYISLCLLTLFFTTSTLAMKEDLFENQENESENQKKRKRDETPDNSSNKLIKVDHTISIDTLVKTWRFNLIQQDPKIREKLIDNLHELSEFHHLLNKKQLNTILTVAKNIKASREVKRFESVIAGNSSVLLNDLPKKVLEKILEYNTNDVKALLNFKNTAKKYKNLVENSITTLDDIGTVTDFNLELFLKIFPQLKNIHHMKWVAKKDDESVDLQLKNSKILTLKNAQEITDRVFKEIMQNFSQLEEFYIIELGVSFDSFITDKCFENISQYLPNLKILVVDMDQ
jgi:hypothetical protein